MKKNILSLNITTGTYKSFLERIHTLAVAQTSSYVCVANVHMTMEAYWDPTFAAAVNGADLVTPDGMPLAKGIKSLYGIQQDRVAGMDLLPDLLKMAEKENLGVFFYGGTQAMLDQTKGYVEKRYPQLANVQFYSPPFRPLTSDEEKEVVENINASGAHLVFVALGCPKQERWMASMKGRIQACMLGIGGALPVMIGMQKRAPKWMQKFSLEWLYRLGQEPKRLFKRYFITNTAFVYLFTKQKFHSYFKKK